MRFLSHILLPSAFVVQHAFAGLFPENEEPLLPINDPFYVPPETIDGVPWNETDRGTILRNRTVTISTLFFPGQSKAKAYQLLYHTMDIHNQSDASVTTVIVPVKPNLKRVLSYQNAYDSPDPNCAPSYGLQYGAKGWSQSWNKIGLTFVAPYLQEGPVLNLPDYEGSNAAFAVGPQSGYQTLDSIRAAAASTEITGIKEDANFIMFGYSGGALATEWATEVKAWYANDTPIIGAVMGGTPTNIAKTYRNVNEGDLAELDTWAMLGIMNSFPDMDEWMRKDLKTDAYQDKKFLLGRSKCSYAEELAEDMEGKDISSWFKSGDYFLAKFEDTINKVGLMGQNITEENDPGYPLAFYYGLSDDVTAPREDTIDLIRRWRGLLGRARVFAQPVLGDHMTAVVPGTAFAVTWINKRFDNFEKGIKDDFSGEEMGLGEIEDFQIPMNLGPSHELR